MEQQRRERDGEWVDAGVERLLDRIPTGRRDLVLAVALGTLAIALHLGFEPDALGALAAPSTLLAIVVLVAMAAALRWRRSHAGAVMGVTGVLTAVFYFAGNESPAAVLLLTFALYAVTAYGEDAREGVLSLDVSLVFMTASFLLNDGLGAVFSASYVLSAFVFGVAWALGRATRTRLALTEELQRRNAQLAVLRERERDELVAEERRRIARELHDVVSHTVSVVVVQAAAARRIGDRDPAAVASALEAIERAAREAMTELRRMLGLLRDEDGGEVVAPTPDNDALGSLVDELRAAGMPVRVEGGVPDDLPPGLVLTVHRIVQESLTNVLRHAEDVGEVVVMVRELDTTLEVEVVDDGRPAGFTDGAGAGLVGMRERAALHGGSVEAGPLPGGRGFRVHAVLPARVAA